MLIAVRVFLGQRVNLQEKYDYPKLAGEYRPRHLGLIADMLPFEMLPARMALVLERGTRGRQVARTGAEPTAH